MVILDDDVDDDAHIFDWEAYHAAREAKKFWTEARLRELKRMYEEGWFTQSIAKALGTTKGAVVGKAQRMGYRHPKALLEGSKAA